MACEKGQGGFVTQGQVYGANKAVKQPAGDHAEAARTALFKP
jgi:hypothetical protein